MNRAVLFDLHGTLGGDGLGNILDFTFFSFSIPAIRLINSAGVLAIVITNQSQIAKGVFSFDQYLDRVHSLQAELISHQVHLDAFYCCPHCKADGCKYCKPLPGLVLQAQKDFDLDLPNSTIVGDTGAWDILLAQAAGCHSVLVRSGLGETSLGEYRSTWAGYQPDFIAADVLEAVRWISGMAN
jgi:histidinol-phosphate phosphatase family protein